MTVNPTPEAVEGDPTWQAILEKYTNQTMLRKYANTATGALGAIIGLIWALASAGLEIPPDVTKWVFSAVAIATAVGLKFTPNGVTAKQLEEIRVLSYGKHASGQ